MFSKQKSVLFLRKLIPYIPPIIPALAFIIVIGYFNILLYYTYQYTQYDLGITYRTLYNFHVSYHLYNWPHPPLEEPETFSKLIYIPLSFTLYIYNAPLTLLFDQIIFIAIGGLTIFFISRQLTNSFKLSLLIEIIYFVYPATYGFMTQGGNLMVFFEPLLLISYYFYIKNNKIMTALFLALAAISNFLAPLIILALLSLPYLSKFFSYIKNVLKSNEKGIIKNKLKFNKETAWQISFFVIPFLFFLISIKLYGLNVLISDSRLSNSTTTAGTSGWNFLRSISDDFSTKLSFLNTVMEPLLYLPLLSIYSLPILVYLLVSWYSNQTTYYDILTRQYTYLFAGFLFISLIHVFKNFNFNKKILKKIAILIIISSVVSFSLYSPFSIGNFQSGNIHKDTTVTPLEKNLTKAFNLIPMNASVLVQNDIVQLDNRPNVYFPGYYNNETVQYAVFIPFTRGIGQSAYSGFDQAIANEFANNASYGIYVRLGNVEIYKLHFVGSPAMFCGEKFNGTGNFYTQSSKTSVNYSFETSYVELSPGYYNLTFVEKVSSASNLTPKDISGKISIMGSNGYLFNYNSTFFESSSIGNFTVFSGKMLIQHFDSYYISLGIQSSIAGNFTFLGNPQFTIISENNGVS